MTNNMPWKFFQSHLRRVLQKYNRPHVLNLHTLAELARRMLAVRDSDRAQ
jgi:hypothetical protein